MKTKRPRIVALTLALAAALMLGAGCDADSISESGGETAATYTVIFDSNNGTGSVERQVFIVGTEQPLRKNTFTRAGHTFTGWNTQTDGDGTVYSDEQTVKNLATSNGATVTLYAQWKQSSTGSDGDNGDTGTDSGGGNGENTDSDIESGDGTSGPGNTDGDTGSGDNTGDNDDDEDGYTEEDDGFFAQLFGWADISYEVTDSDNGYMYGNNYKAYTITLTITNISGQSSPTVDCAISAGSNLVTLSGTSLTSITIQPLSAGSSHTITFTAQADYFTNVRLDTSLIVTLASLSSDDEASRHLSLRFYRGVIPITIAAEADSSTGTSLSLLLINPDGNSQTATLDSGTSKTLYVPALGTSDPFLLAVTAQEGYYYTVAQGTKQAITVVVPSDTTNKRTYYTYGEDNNTAETAFTAPASFEAYCDASDVDYYKLTPSLAGVMLPSGEEVYTVTYKSDYAPAPAPLQCTHGTYLLAADLPELNFNNYKFLGWYLGGVKVNAPYQVTANLTLVAGWTTTGLDVEVVQPQNDITLTYTQDGTNLVLTAAAGYTNYGWRLDGKVISDAQSSTLTLDTASWERGSYEIYVEAQKDGNWYSATAYITVGGNK